MNMLVVYVLALVAGNAVIIGLVALLFGSARRRLGAPDDVEARLCREVPGFRAGDCAVACDADAAIVDDVGNGTPILVKAMGGYCVIRKLSRDTLRHCARDGVRLILTLTDFTLPRVTIRLAEESEALVWERRLEERWRTP